jgi:hypothetical protein
MDNQEFIRIRTDTAVALVGNLPVDADKFLKAVKEFYGPDEPLLKEDAALMSALPSIIQQKPQYRMNDLNKPSFITNIKLPEAYDDYMSNQRKFSTSYTQDWPQPHKENPFGKRHPFSWELPTCPLLHGAQWGEPAFINHLLHLIEEDEEGKTILQTMQEAEKMGVLPQTYEDILGRPHESQHQLYKNDKETRHSFISDDEYIDVKKKEWNNLGMLSYLFGTEWQSPDQNEAFMGMLRKLGQTESPNSPAAKKIINDMPAATGMSWGRAKRNYFERFLPIARWWQRASDRHGPVSADDMNSDLKHFKSPFVEENGGIVPSHTHHWWNPFQYWGGVGRSHDSLISVMKQSYPDAFDGWVGNDMLDFLKNENHPLNDSEDAYHSSGSSYFPETANHESMKGHPHRSAIATGWEVGSEHPRVKSFNARRGLWGSVSNHHHLHPSEVEGSGKRMIIPSEALITQPLGRIVSAHSDMGMPRNGMSQERHPGDEQYHAYHNDHYEKTDENLGKVMQEMAIALTKDNPDLFNAHPSDVRGVTVARGNIQQLAQAANYQLMRNGHEKLKSIAPSVLAGGLNQQHVPIGPVHPTSKATTPPVYLTGDKDAWGHKMPTTLAWNYDRKGGNVRFDIKDKSFDTLQRTAHEGHVNMVNPTILPYPTTPKQNNIPALFVTNDEGHAPIVSGDIWKSDDYEPTGIFRKVINPAHTIYDLHDIGDLKGFSGNWVIQEKPEGKRVIISKKGNEVKGINKEGRKIKLPDIVKKGIREQEGNCTFDGVLKGKKFRAIDLLVHKDEDIHMEMLEDRLNLLRTMYETDEGVSFPMPANCKFTDQDGLKKSIDSIKGDVWLRDATSTFMKGKEVHHKWILYTVNGDDITKGLIPHVSRRNGSVILEYTGHPSPVVVNSEWDGSTLTLKSIKPNNPLGRHAEHQFELWGPVAAHLCKYDIKEITPYPPTIPTLNTLLFTKASLLEPSGEGSASQEKLTEAKQHLMDNDEALTLSELKTKVKGLTSSMVNDFGGEYGLEQTEGGKWSVNEALDDEMIEEKAISSAIAVGAMTGGGWSGMMDAHNAPRGPTELVDEEATPFYDPYQSEEGDMPKQPLHITLQTTDDAGEEIEGELEVEGPAAILRYPQKTKHEAEKEANVNVPLEEEEEVPIPASLPPQPPNA